MHVAIIYYNYMSFESQMYRIIIETDAFLIYQFWIYTYTGYFKQFLSVKGIVTENKSYLINLFTILLVSYILITITLCANVE